MSRKKPLFQKLTWLDDIGHWICLNINFEKQQWYPIFPSSVKRFSLGRMSFLTKDLCIRGSEFELLRIIRMAFKIKLKVLLLRKQSYLFLSSSFHPFLCAQNRPNIISHRSPTISAGMHGFCGYANSNSRNGCLQTQGTLLRKCFCDSAICGCQSS